jgi:glc operon protein GlcG
MVDLQTAHVIITAAHDRARELGLRITVAVVDEGGLLIALGRMDGAFPLSAQIAEAKAQGAAVWHRDGHVIAEQQAARPAFVVSGATPDEDRTCAEAGLAALGA